MNENKLDDKVDYPVMMKLPRVPCGIVRAIFIIFLRPNPRQLPSLRLEFPQADCLWRRKRALQETESQGETNENRFGKIYPSDNIPPAPWANQYNINTTHDSFMVGITVPIVTAKRIVRSKRV